MSLAEAAERSLRDGDLAAALAQLQDQVRQRPSDAKLRVFLFQLLCVLGQWDRALNQLQVAASLDPAAIPMEQTYGAAIRCEAIRAEVFRGAKSPMIFGEPDQWLALLIESLLSEGMGEHARSVELRARAFEEAPASPGRLNDRSFDWIADADSRIGPVVEAVINGRYYWVPFARLTRVTIEPPADLRDFVWMPAHFDFENGGEAFALVPTRYPGSHEGEGAIALARKTTWEEVAENTYVGLGQRVLATSGDETPLMEVRTIELDGAGEPAAPADSNG